MRGGLRLLTLVAALALVAAACTGGRGDPIASGDDAPSIDVKACLVSNDAGIEDLDLGGYNHNAHKGLQEAERTLGVQTKVVEPASSADFEEHIVALVDERCDLIITVGRLMGDATRMVAIQNPDQRFAIVDFTYDPPLENVLGLDHRSRAPWRFPRSSAISATVNPTSWHSAMRASR